MARIRTIKPEFWTHEELSSVSETAALLAIALLNYSDDHGYFKANPALVKANCFPLRDTSKTVPGALAELSRIGYLEFGRDKEDRLLGRVVRFDDHQRVDKAKDSLIGPVFEPIPCPFQEDSKNDPGTVLDVSEEEGKGSGKGREVEKEQGNGSSLREKTGVSSSALPIVVENQDLSKLQPFQQVKIVLSEIASRLEVDPPTDQEVRRWLKDSSPVRQMIAKYGLRGAVEIATYAMRTSAGCGWARIWEANSSFARQARAGVESAYGKKNGKNQSDSDFYREAFAQHGITPESLQ